LPPDQEGSRERRWILLGEDGRYVTLGRHSDPSEREIVEAESNLRRLGRAGWLAIMQGNPHFAAPPSLMMVRPLANPSSAFADAVHMMRTKLTSLD
jgi:hypothetical protein